MNKIDYYSSDPIWKKMRVNTQDEFITKILPNIGLASRVPDEIKNLYTTIVYLITSSYFHYNLLDEALSKALFTTELALKLRYKELTGKVWKDVRFKKSEKNPIRGNKTASSKRNNLETLIEEISKYDVFSKNINFLHSIRSLRNSFAHLDGERLMGTFSLRWLKTLTLIINELYEDPLTRKMRSERVDSINEELKCFIDDKVLAYIFEPNNSLPVFKFECVFFDETRDSYLLQIVPVFDLSQYEGKDFHGQVPIIFTEVKGLEINKKDMIIRGVLSKNTEYTELTSPLINSLTNSTYKDWLPRYNILEQRPFIELDIQSKTSDKLIDAKQEYLVRVIND